MNNSKSILKRSVSKMLRPLVRILIRYGLSCSEFTELVKHLYVEVANKDYAIDGRKQSISRVAILTGLSRKDVQKVKNDLAQAPVDKQLPINRANRVILGWLKDEEFLDTENNTAVIPLHGSQASFDVLVKRYSGDITPRAILDELMRIGAVRKNEPEHLELVTEGYIPKSDQDKINVMAKCVHDQISTIDFNITHPSYEARFQRQVRYVDLPIETIKEFKEYSKEKSIEFIMGLNIWLDNKKKNILNQNDGDNRSNNNVNYETSRDTKELGKVGFGLYYFEGDNDADD